MLQPVGSTHRSAHFTGITSPKYRHPILVNAPEIQPCFEHGNAGIANMRFDDRIVSSLIGTPLQRPAEQFRSASTTPKETS